jgi:hypothetical protein
MNRPYTNIALYSEKSKALIPAIAYQGFTEQNLDDLYSYKKWNSLLVWFFPSLSYEDDHWNWSRKNNDFKNLNGCQCWVVECENLLKKRQRVTQGAIIFMSGKSPATLKPLVKIEFLATAPHNRTRSFFFGIKILKRYRGVGSTLLDIASSYSGKKGYLRVIGLYALPEAEEFYSKLGLVRYDQIRDDEGLVYFEGIV